MVLTEPLVVELRKVNWLGAKHAWKACRIRKGIWVGTNSFRQICGRVCECSLYIPVWKSIHANQIANVFFVKKKFIEDQNK